MYMNSNMSDIITVFTKVFTTVFNADLVFKSVYYNTLFILLYRFTTNVLLLAQLRINLCHTIFINYAGCVNIVSLYYNVHCCLC